MLRANSIHSKGEQYHYGVNVIVMKFGGTSLKDARAFRAARDRISERRSRSPVVVVSACSGVTSSLLAATVEAVAGSAHRAADIVNTLYERHRAIADELLAHASRENILPMIEIECETLHGTLRELSLLRDAPPKTVDGITAMGELWSSRLLHALLLDSALPAVLIPATQLLVTDDQFSRANPDLEESGKRIRSRVPSFLDLGKVVITQGFIGSTGEGNITTIGRGGSDFSAAIIGSALGAEEIEIWTDVNGVLSADPAVVPDALPLDDITYEEHTELSHYGARVLHPSTFLPAMESDISLRVMNSFDPSFPGTVIRPKRTTDPGKRVTSITSKHGVSVVSVLGRKDRRRRDLVAEFIRVLAARGRDIEFLVNSEAGVSFVSDAGENDLFVLRQLADGSQVSQQNYRAIVCVVGENIRRRRDVGIEAHDTLAKAGIHIDSVFDGVSEHSLVFLLDEDVARRAVKTLHDQFFRPVGNPVELTVS